MIREQAEEDRGGNEEAHGNSSPKVLPVLGWQEIFLSGDKISL